MTAGILAITLDSTLAFTQGCISMFLLAAGSYFLLQRGNRLKRILGWTLLFWFAMHMKDLLLLDVSTADYDYMQKLLMSFDMLAVPTCAFLLLELVHPGWLTWRKAILHEALFLLFPLLYWAWPVQIIFTTNLVAALLYSLSVIFHLFHAIPEYNRMLSENYSYTDAIDLVWLWKLLIFFIFFLVVWAYSCIRLSADADILYNMASCGLWAVICYYIDRQETLPLGEAESPDDTEEQTNEANHRPAALAQPASDDPRRRSSAGNQSHLPLRLPQPFAGHDLLRICERLPHPRRRRAARLALLHADDRSRRGELRVQFGLDIPPRLHPPLRMHTEPIQTGTRQLIVLPIPYKRTFRTKSPLFLSI